MISKLIQIHISLAPIWRWLLIIFKSVWFNLCLTDWKWLLNSVTSNIWNFKYFYYWGHNHIVEHLHDIMALQINNFNSFFNSCNNLWGLSGKYNILWMTVASKSHLPYIWHNDCKVVVSHYRPPKSDVSAGNNYRQILSKYENVLNNPTCMYYHFYSICDDNMDIITVLRDMIDVRDGFKTCADYTNNDVEDIINDICLNWNVKLTVFYCSIVLLHSVNKDIDIIIIYAAMVYIIKLLLVTQYVLCILL